MQSRPLGLDTIAVALTDGWQLANATRGTSITYAAIFTLIGAVILGLLLSQGFTPFVLAAAGAFMLVGPATLAGFFGIAQAHEERRKAGAITTEEAASGQSGFGEGSRERSERYAETKVGVGATVQGFAAASNAIWVIALISALLFMIFVTDAAILYSYMVGGTPVWLTELIPATAGVMDFLFWGAVSGFVIAFLLFCISAFSVPLLCERRAGLVNAVVASVRVVFGNFLPAMTWAALLSGLIIGSILLLPLLPLTLPWLAYASRALYRQVFP